MKIYLHLSPTTTTPILLSPDPTTGTPCTVPDSTVARWRQAMIDYADAQDEMWLTLQASQVVRPPAGGGI